MTILNLTQHTPTPDQRAAGVVDSSDPERLRALLTVEELPSAKQVRERARKLVVFARAEGAEVAMVAGAPWLMPDLVKRLKGAGIKPVFAFSKRETVEEATEDGAVVRRTVFRHLGFVEI